MAAEPASGNARGRVIAARHERCAACPGIRPPGFAEALRRALNGPSTGAKPQSPLRPKAATGREVACMPECPAPSPLAAHCPKRIAHAHRDGDVFGTTEIP